MKWRDSLLAGGLVEAKGRRTPRNPYETVEPVEFSGLRLFGQDALNPQREIVFYHVRMSGSALSRARQQLMSSEDGARGSSALPIEGAIGPETKRTVVQLPSASQELLLRDTSKQKLGRRSPTETPTPAPRRRGPLKGSINRYREADRALCPELERITKEDHLTLSAAALKLAEADTERKILLGHGTPLSRAKRLVKRYNADAKIKLTETC
jgi:hypothetical protein